MNYDQVKILVFFINLLCMHLGNGFLIQCMKNTDSFKFRMTANSGNIIHLINNYRISNKGFATINNLCNVISDQATQINQQLKFANIDNLIANTNNTTAKTKLTEASFATEQKEMPTFKSGDTITVSYKIIEGSKERVQQYRGVVIKIVGHGDKKRFTVRKISENIGVERVFPMDSPFISNVEVNKYGKVRRAKLYYLRNLTGKKARIRERRI